MQVAPFLSSSTMAKPVAGEQTSVRQAQAHTKAASYEKVADERQPELVVSHVASQHVERTTQVSEGQSSRAYHAAEALLGEENTQQEADTKQTSAIEAAAPKSISGDPLPEGQQAAVRELKARDQAVRNHEAAHKAAGGAHAGSASFTYQRGPDGTLYAVGGEVSIDMSPVDGNPEATIRKMETVRAAAMAPADPSPQDRSIASRAIGMIMQARAELAEQAKQNTGIELAEKSGGIRHDTPLIAENSYKTFAQDAR